MASFNKVLLMGNLTRDPQLKYLPSQTEVVDFGMACSRKYKTQSGEQKEEVLFVDCSAFGRTASLINEHFTKGKPIFIEGRLRYEQWEDKNGGGKRSRLSVSVDNFQFIGGDRAEGGGQQSERPRAARPPARAAEEQPFPNDEGIDDGSIPF